VIALATLSHGGIKFGEEMIPEKVTLLLLAEYFGVLIVLIARSFGLMRL